MTLLSIARLRVAGLGVLLAAGIWMLLLGTCYTMGGVRPMFL